MQSAELLFLLQPRPAEPMPLPRWPAPVLPLNVTSRPTRRTKAPLQSPKAAAPVPASPSQSPNARGEGVRHDSAGRMYCHPAGDMLLHCHLISELEVLERIRPASFFFWERIRPDEPLAISERVINDRARTSRALASIGPTPAEITTKQTAAAPTAHTQ